MEITLGEIGTEMYSVDDGVVWELQLPDATVHLRLGFKDLEELFYLLADELHFFADRQQLHDVDSTEEELPIGTDCIETLPDVEEDTMSMLDDFDSCDDETGY